MKPVLILTVLFSSTFFATITDAQNWYQDYVVNECARYSPYDHCNRGLIYRMQTGHAGHFSNCDDDLEKMNSPYISWRCRPSRPYKPVADFLDDFHRRSRRLLNGAGDCASGNCVTEQCTKDCGNNCHCNTQPVGSHFAERSNSTSPERIGKAIAKPNKSKPVVGVARRGAVQQTVPTIEQAVTKKTIKPSRRQAYRPEAIPFR